MNSIKLYWNDISETNKIIPKGNGVYAWYYSPRISDHDINRLYENGIKLTEHDISLFLNKFVFNFFSEEAYAVELTGKLKPRYKGSIEHVEQCSKSLVKKIVSKQVSLEDIQQILTEFSEPFLSPIYIGMAENLAKRINQHKKIISNYRDGTSINGKSEDRDSNFAERVVSKNYINSNLFVLIKELNCDRKLETVAENIMNRINYPILGRN